MATAMNINDEARTGLSFRLNESKIDLDNSKQDESSWKSSSILQEQQQHQQQFMDALKIDEKISNMDVKEAMKKLTQSARRSQECASNEEGFRSSSGPRFYNWNTTHFYPDVHKLDIGILFRHSRCSDSQFCDRNSSDHELGYRSDSSSEQDYYKTARREYSHKKMLLAETPRSHIEDGSVNENGLGVKIDIDLDSFSESDDNENHKLWHKSPLHVRCIRRNDGRPLSAEINYDAASKKLYIHTLSKKKVDSVETQNSEYGQSSKVSRRLSAPGTGGHHRPAKKHVRKAERAKREQVHNAFQPSIGEVRNQQSLMKSNSLGVHMKVKRRREFIKERGKSQGLNFYEDLCNNYGPGRGEREHITSNATQENSQQGLLNRSQKDIHYIEPAPSQCQVNGQMNENWLESASCQLNIENKIKNSESEEKPKDKCQTNINGKHPDYDTHLVQVGNQYIIDQTDLKDSGFIVPTAAGGVGQYHGTKTSSSFENIYDSVHLDPKINLTNKVELYQRKGNRISSQPIVNGVGSGSSLTPKQLSSSDFSNISSSSFLEEVNYKQSLTEDREINKMFNDDFGPLCQRASSQSLHDSKPDFVSQASQKNMHIDAKTIMEEEKRKFEEYKMEYHRKHSGLKDMNEKYQYEIDSIKNYSVDEDQAESKGPIPPDEYVYILKKILHKKQDAQHFEPPRLCTVNNNVNMSDLKAQHTFPLTKPKEGLASEKIFMDASKVDMENGLTSVSINHQKLQVTYVDVYKMKPKPIQLPSEIYLSRSGYNHILQSLTGGAVIDQHYMSGQLDFSEPKTSAFHHVIQSVEPSANMDLSCGGLKISSHHPDLIPLPSSSTTDVKRNTSALSKKSDPEETSQSQGTQVLHLDTSDAQLTHDSLGLLQKPPKPRNEVYLGSTEPKHWMYNTTYEPSTPPILPVVTFARMHSVSPHEQLLLPPPPPSPPPPLPPSLPASSPSASMEIFRLLPEQCQLNIMESPVMDILNGKNEVFPMYLKQSVEGRLPKPMNTSEVLPKSVNVAANSVKQNCCLSSVAQPQSAADVSGNSRADFEVKPRYDKATVFSLTGYHKPQMEKYSSHGSEGLAYCPLDLSLDVLDNSSIFEPERSNDASCFRDYEKCGPNSYLNSHFHAVNAGSLKQTLWTDAEKRRPLIWKDSDKPQSIVDWPDLDVITVENEANPSMVDPHKPFMPRGQQMVGRKDCFSGKMFDINGAHDNEQDTRDYKHIGNTSHSFDIFCSPEIRIPENLSDMYSSTSYQVDMKSSKLPLNEGHLLESGYDNGQKLFYAVKVPALQTNIPYNHVVYAQMNGLSPLNESIEYPPPPSSRVPQYHENFSVVKDSSFDILQSPSHSCADEQPGQSEADPMSTALHLQFAGLGSPSLKVIELDNVDSPNMSRLAWPHLQDAGMSKGRDLRSGSEPNILRPCKTESDRQLQKMDADYEPLCQQLPSLAEKGRIQQNAYENQSKASAVYEKHINRSQELYKAKKMSNLEPRTRNNLLMSKDLKLSLRSLKSAAHLDEPGSKENTGTPKANLPKQKSALELHLSSSFGKTGSSPCASALPTPASDEFKRIPTWEPFNIKVDIQPPSKSNGSQLFGMSVHLSGSQELGLPCDDEVPQVSISAIKAKLFAQNEDGSEKALLGQQLPVNQEFCWVPASRRDGKFNAEIKDLPLSENLTAISQKGKNQMDDDRLYDYVSYKDGLKKKQSKLNDHLTDFERICERLELDDYAGNEDDAIIDSCAVQYDKNGHIDSSSVKCLSITNLKILSESQTKSIPNPSLEYTKRWVQNGKGLSKGTVAGKQQPSIENPPNNFSQQDYRSTSRGSRDSSGNFPRKTIDDMAYRKYGSTICAKSDTDLPARSVLLLSSPSNTSSPNNSSALCMGYLSKGSSSQPSDEAEKIHVDLQKNSQNLSRCSGHAPEYDAMSCLSKPQSASLQTRGTRINLHLLNRSSSFEAPCEETNPEVICTPLSSGVARLVELFEVSQSAPDLTEADLFGESYTETGDLIPDNPKYAKHAVEPNNQKVLNDENEDSANKSRIRQIKMNVEPAFIENETDSGRSSGPKLRPIQNETTAGDTTDSASLNTQTIKRMEMQNEQEKLGVHKSDVVYLSDTSAKKTDSAVVERMKCLQKLRKEWFQKKVETPKPEKSVYQFKQFQSVGVMPNSGKSMSSCTSAAVVLPTDSEQIKSKVTGGQCPFPFASPLHSENIKIGGLDCGPDSSFTPKENVGKLRNEENPVSYSTGLDDRINTRIEQCIGLDSVRGPEIQKTTLNLRILTPVATDDLEKGEGMIPSHVSLSSIELNGMALNSGQHEPHTGRSSVNQNYGVFLKHHSIDFKLPPINERSFQTEKLPKPGLLNEKEDRSFRQETSGDKTIAELKTEKMKYEPWQFGASKTFGRVVDQPEIKTFEYESQEFQHKEERYRNADIKITKQHTQTRAERSYKIEKKPLENSSAKVNSSREEAVVFPSQQKPSVFERLEFSDGEMTDATDVTLDAMVGINQLRPSSPEILDFSDMEVLSSTNLSRISEKKMGGLFTKTEIMDKSTQSSSKVLQKPFEMAQYNVESCRSPLREDFLSRETLIAKAQAEMKLYRKDKEDGQVPERKLSIKELVNSFEVMSSPFMRAHQKSSEVRSEDVDKAIKVATERGYNRKNCN